MNNNPWRNLVKATLSITKELKAKQNVKNVKF